MFTLDYFNKNRKIIFTSILSSGLEFYDFIVYLFLAPILKKLFFPEGNAFLALLLTFAIFAIGYLARPIGGIIFSHYGDTIGRKSVFVLTISGMGLSTFLIGLLPSYQSIGILAPLLLITLRIIQGLSLGGEIPGAIIFIVEHGHKRHRALMAALIFVGVNLGIFLGAGLSSLAFKLLPLTDMMHWGWRILFMLGGFLGFLIYFLRKSLSESPAFNREQVVKFPVAEVLRYSFPKVIRNIFLVAFGATTVVIVQVYMPSYLHLYFHYPLSSTSFLSTMSSILLCIEVIFFALIADKFGRLPVLIFSCVTMSLFSFFCFKLFSGNYTSVIFSLILLTFFESGIVATYTIILAESFSAAHRYTGFAISYNMGFAVFGGTTPLVSTYLIKLSNNIYAPSFYLTVLALLALIAGFSLRNKKSALI